MYYRDRWGKIPELLGVSSDQAKRMTRNEFAEFILKRSLLEEVTCTGSGLRHEPKQITLSLKNTAYQRPCKMVHISVFCDLDGTTG